MPASPTEQSIAEHDDDELTLPWWFSWWRVALLAAGVTIALIATGGLIMRAQQPGNDSPDAGFLRDMRDHHDQAVFMAMTFRDQLGIDATLRTMATEIALGQSFETGQMVELLRGMHAEEENSTGTAMTWMGMNVPTDQMPGMATADQLTALAGSEGAAADKLFVQLMNAHHEGGIHMADSAVRLANSSRIRELAQHMADNQRSEITELSTALAKALAAT